MCVCARARVCVCVCARACVRVCVCVRLYVRERDREKERENLGRNVRTRRCTRTWRHVHTHGSAHAEPDHITNGHIFSSSNAFALGQARVCRTLACLEFFSARCMRRAQCSGIAFAAPRGTSQHVCWVKYECGAGLKYSAEAGATADATCEACPDNSASPAASTVAAACVCLANASRTYSVKYQCGVVLGNACAATTQLLRHDICSRALLHPRLSPRLHYRLLTLCPAAY